MKIKFLWVFVLSVFSFGAAKGQVNVEIVDGMSPISHKTSLLGKKISHVLADKDGKKTVFTVDSDGRLDLIVEFVDEPLIVQEQTAKLQGKLSIKVDQSSHRKRFDQFQKDVEEITRHNRMKSSGKGGAQRAKPASIHRKYSRAFSGVHLKLSSSHDIESIKSLPYVKNIYNNYKVKVNLPEKAKKTHTDQVRQRSSYSGKGVTVAIIDSGIDYTHPALGGGLGEGYKVIGGYDFVNEDEDPMDDAGHGTHVAGIVAADSDIMQGVAPDVRLVAYKVLDSSGSGEISDIIAAIERTIDPNMDGDFSDRIDVVNISLGSDFGGPDDPASRAVDAAVAAGVVFVIAAGNSGNFGFHTIGAPSAARSAITVGASEQNQLARFSSKGPNRGSYGVKPEVVGPGVDIMSTVLSGKYETFSGTSMAAPYVAGIAALLKERHPDEKPAQIKSLIMGSAESLNEDIMAQGAGLVNVLGALNSETTVLPSALNFGLNSKKSPHWIVRKKIKVVNNSNKKQRYKVSAKHLPSGVKVMAFPHVFHLSPGKSKKISVFLWAKNRQVPFPQDGLAYGGLLKVKSKDDVINIPWSFVRAAEVELNFDEDFPLFFIFNKKYIRDTLSANMIDLRTFSLIMPPGVYDIVSSSISNDKTHTAEQKRVKGIRKYDINFSEAVHSINMAGVDHNGTPFSALSPSMYIAGINMLPPKGSLLEVTMFGSEARGELAAKWLFSPVSERYKFLTGEMHVTDKLAYVVNYPPINGIHGDVNVVPNASNEFFMDKIHVQVPPNKRERGSSVFFNAVLPGFTVINESGPVDSDLWSGTLYMTPQVYDDTLKFSASVTAALPAPAPDSAGDPEFAPFSDLRDPESDPIFWLQTLPFYFVDNKIGSFSGAEPLATTYLSESGLTFGRLPLYGKVLSANNLEANKSHIMIQPIYSGPLDEEYLPLGGGSTISIYDENGVIQSSEPIGGGFYFKELLPAKYTYELSSVEGEYIIGNKLGKATYTAHIDLSLEDATPPAFTSVRLADESGQPIDSITQGKSASLSFSVADLHMVLDDKSPFPRTEYQPMDQNNVKLFVREWSSETWQPVVLTYIAEDSVGVIGADPVGHIYSADLSDLGMKGEISFMISAEDRNGNISEWMMEPGFSVSEE